MGGRRVWLFGQRSGRAAGARCDVPQQGGNFTAALLPAANGERSRRCRWGRKYRRAARHVRARDRGYSLALKIIRATPHNLASRFGEKFSAKARFEKCRNTLRIPHFSNRRIGGKAPAQRADAIARYCPHFFRRQIPNRLLCPKGSPEPLFVLHLLHIHCSCYLEANPLLRFLYTKYKCTQR